MNISTQRHIAVLITLIVLSALSHKSAAAADLKFSISRIEYTDFPENNAKTKAAHLLLATANPTHIIEMLSEKVATIELFGAGKLTVEGKYAAERVRTVIGIVPGGAQATSSAWRGYRLSVTKQRPVNLHGPEGDRPMTELAITFEFSDFTRRVEQLAIMDHLYINANDIPALSIQKTELTTVTASNTPTQMVVPCGENAFFYLRMEPTP